MSKTFIQVAQEAEKLGAKHLPIFFETPCSFFSVKTQQSEWIEQGHNCIDFPTRIIQEEKTTRKGFFIFKEIIS